MIRSASPFALLLVFAACSGPETAESVESSTPTKMLRDAVVGGVTDNDDPEVFQLVIQGNNGVGSGCTATLIDRRTLLTAAHCVDPRIIEATSVTIYAYNKTTENQVTQADLFRVTETRFHPSWNPNLSLQYDIGLALLDRAPPVTPKPWSTASLNGLSGRPIRVVGYGSNRGGPNGGSGAGIKRQANLTFRQILQDIFFLGNQQTIGICHGDSGGPSFYTFPDGVERQVGVHSFTNGEECLDGADTRVDFYQSFIQTWLNQKEAASCAEDGRCASGCATPDVDCLCAANGTCNPQCPDLTKDPDCPKDCVSNGICATESCPSRDVDCVDVGAACTAATQCVSRACISTAQHPAKFCSASCTQDSDCPMGLSCSTGATRQCVYPDLPEVAPGGPCTKGQTFCTQNTVCTGKNQAFSYCQYGCASSAECPGNRVCVKGFDDTFYCEEPPPIYLPAAPSTLGAPKQCSVTGGAGLLGLGAWLLRRRRRQLSS